MPELVVCSRCGALETVLVRSLCRACHRQEWRDLLRVRAHLRAHPGLAAPEVSEALDLPLERILGWIREGRLLTERPQLTCDRCGRPIKAGTQCPVCRTETTHAILVQIGDLHKTAEQQVASKREIADRAGTRRERRSQEGQSGERFDLR